MINITCLLKIFGRGFYLFLSAVLVFLCVCCSSNSVDTDGVNANPVVNEDPPEEAIKDPVGTISTTIPVTQNREANVYNWDNRHKEILQINKKDPPKVVFIGNSIIHYWAGEPRASIKRGETSWSQYFKHVRNLGFGWDRIENVLWRVHNGELDGYKATHIVVLIGTNNLTVNTDDEIVEGLSFLVQSIKRHQPSAEIILMGLLPRRNYESRIATLNGKISAITGILKIKYADSDNLLLDAHNGKINETLFSDGVHPNEDGYGLIAPFINTYLQQ